MTTQTSVRIIDATYKNIHSLKPVRPEPVLSPSCQLQGDGGKLRELTTNNRTTTDFLQSVKAIIMEETDNGRIIVKFLLSAALGEFPDFQPCHQLEAARLLQKYSGQEVKAIINNLNLPPATRRERRDARRADRYVHSELAQIVQQETDNGRTIVTFLVQAMEGELQDFQPCHRMSAAKELLKQGSQCSPLSKEEAGQAEPEPDPQEQERQRQQEAARLQREEDIEFSLHGDLFYDIYPFPCTCEDRLHDCEGNLRTGEDLEFFTARSPMRYSYLRWGDTPEAYKERYREYLTRRNARFPHNPIHFDQIYWKDP